MKPAGKFKRKFSNTPSNTYYYPTSKYFTSFQAEQSPASAQQFRLANVAFDLQCET